MPNDYRALHNQYSQGMAQSGTVQPNSTPGFNFLQGWGASPSAGYMPPKGPTQQPIQYGDPTQGGWIGGADGQPVGGYTGSQWGAGGDPRAMLNDGIKGNFAEWQNAYGGSNQQGGQLGQAGGNLRASLGMQQPSMQANFGMQQPTGGFAGKDPYPVDPIALPKPQPNFGIPMPKPQPNFGIPMPKPILGGVQYDQYGKPIPVDQLNPGRDPNLPPIGYGWGG